MLIYDSSIGIFANIKKVIDEVNSINERLNQLEDEEFFDIEEVDEDE